ncbi:TetR family transcriptional regulator [Nocardiopsis sp. Huas11]|nr:TetR family transcriptional regulator [Nocardiopsis sp. Huas11]
MTRSDQVAVTRETILATAERLFAEHGPAGVSNRQISQEAGQGNNTAVSYHFGSKDGLVRAIVRRHTEQIDEIRHRMVARADGSTAARDWVACMVEPFAQHLDDLGPPTWFGRFSAQVMTDSAYREVMTQEALDSPPLRHAAERLKRLLPDLPPDILVERQDMVGRLMVYTIAERERTLAVGDPLPADSWARVASRLTDALTGLWLAPVTELPTAP